MAINDSNYAVLQGSLFMQKRLLNGAAVGPMFPVGDADIFQLSPNQKFEDVQESQSGLGLTAFHVPVETKISYKLNIKNFQAANIERAIYGNYGGLKTAGTVTAEVVSAFNLTNYANGIVPLANPGVSSVVSKLYAGTGGTGTAGAIASIAVTNGGSGYTPNSALALTITGAPGTAATALAYTNAAGVIVGAVVTAIGSGYVAPTATVTTPGGGSLATFQVNLNAATLTLNTDYTVDATNGAITILPTSLLVPAATIVNGYTPADGTYGVAQLTFAYSYAAYTGKIEAFTTGIQYFTMRLNGFNIANAQPVIANVYQAAVNMTKMLDFIAKKSINIELDGELVQDSTKPLPTATSQLSQFFNIIKG